MCKEIETASDNVHFLPGCGLGGWAWSLRLGQNQVFFLKPAYVVLQNQKCSNYFSAERLN